MVEWLFFAFTTLQGVAIFFAHCVLNREVCVCVCVCVCGCGCVGVMSVMSVCEWSYVVVVAVGSVGIPEDHGVQEDG